MADPFEELWWRDPSSWPSWDQPQQSLQRALHRFTPRPRTEAVVPPIEWSAQRKLAWSDFLGAPDFSSGNDAESDVYFQRSEMQIVTTCKAVTLDKCQSATHFTKDKPPKEVACDKNCGSFFEAGASFTKIAFAARFDPMKSWVSNAVLRGRDTDDLLAHEQGHFDLDQIWARSLTAAAGPLTTKAYSCSEVGARRKAGMQLIKQLEDLAEDHGKKLDQEQKQYDNQTQHGTVENQQKAWKTAIAGRIVR